MDLIYILDVQIHIYVDRSKDNYVYKIIVLKNE